MLGVLLRTVMWIKVIILCWFQLAILWTLPRFRYDHIQVLVWRMLLPAGLLNIFVTGALVLWDPSLRALALVGLVEIAVVAALTARRHPEEGAPGDRSLEAAAQHSSA